MNEPAPRPSKKTTAVVRTTANKAVETTNGAARDLARRTSAGIEANPLGVLVGGVALGVLAGAFLPRSDGEEKLLAPVGKRIADTARGAADAARETAKSEFDVLGLTRTAARDQAGKLLEGVLKAVSTAGAAALAAKIATPAAEPAAAEAPKTHRPAK